MNDQQSILESLQQELKLCHKKIEYLEGILDDNDIKECHSCHHHYADECWVICYLCDDVTCVTCRNYCSSCCESVCQRCIISCSKNPRFKCISCHLCDCGLCWQFEYFHYLSDNLQKLLFTILLCWKQLRTKLCVPPKFIRLIIFRELINLSR